MRILLTAILAGAASLAVASAMLPAGAQKPRLVTVLLPTGQLVQVQYADETAPQPAALFASLPRPGTVFDAMDRVSAMMDRQADAMLRRAVQISTMRSGGMLPDQMLPETQFYSVSTSFSSQGGCTQSTEISYTGNGAKPSVVSSVSGDCGPTQNHAAPMFQLEPGQAVPTQSGGRRINASPADQYKQMIKPAVLISR